MNFTCTSSTSTSGFFSSATENLEEDVKRDTRPKSVSRRAFFVETYIKLTNLGETPDHSLSSNYSIIDIYFIESYEEAI